MTRNWTCLVVVGVGLLVATTAGAQPAPSCENWTIEFFRTATVEDVTACLDAGVDPMARGPYSENTALHMAAFASTSPEVIAVLLAAGADVHARADSGTPLESATGYQARQEPAVIEALLAAGADPNVRDSNNWMPLHQAAFDAENADVIRALIAAGAEVDARTRGNIHSRGDMTPLHLAVSSGADPAAIEALLARQTAPAPPRPPG